MQKEINFFSGIKSVYFMLLACLTLSICATSCSSDDEFETTLPEEQRQYTKAELIEQALSRMPQTRGENPNAVVMVTIENTVSFRCWTLDSMMIDWGDGLEAMTPKLPNVEYSHTYTDNKPSHAIRISGSKEAIRNLLVNDNKLIFLDVSYNANMLVLNCTNNYLDEIDLTGCLGLQYLYLSNNELSSIEVSHLSTLLGLDVKDNRLTVINISKNQKLARLWIGKNKITTLDLSGNPNLFILETENNPITALDLTQHTEMVTLNVSYTSITELDLKRNTKLQSISLEGLSLETFNNHLIGDMSFAIYPQLKQLNVAYTPFTALDLFYNPLLQGIDISGTEITQLDLSELTIEYLFASYSQLTNIIYTPSNFTNLFELRIERTPFEKTDAVLSLAKRLPDRTGISAGHLHSFSPHLDSLAFCLDGMNWLIN
ncbi:MAG: hypothetical protein NC410_10195 [Oscillibacter sp.]|nr:hypothetical protein [Oscillibacter sp.]